MEVVQPSLPVVLNRVNGSAQDLIENDQTAVNITGDIKGSVHYKSISPLIIKIKKYQTLRE